MKDIFKNNRIIVFALSLTALIISSLIGVTYAFYSYNAINSNAVSGGSDYECSQQVTYTKGQDIAGALTMGSSYTSGEYVEVKMNVASGCSTLLGTLYLNTREESTMDYSDQALRYTVVSDSTVVSEGTVTGEEKQIIYTNFPITSTSKTYRIYIWLDASKEDLTNFDIEIYNGFISSDAKATDFATATLANLGLTSSLRTGDLSTINTSSYQGTYNEVKANLTSLCSGWGYSVLNNCVRSEFGEAFQTFDDYYANMAQTQDSGIYAVEDDLGTSYVFRGNVSNNYVKFGKYEKNVIFRRELNPFSYSWDNSSSVCSDEGQSCKTVAHENDDMYWKIIRINGDGTIRMMYIGTEPIAVGRTLGSIGYAPFNINENSNTYVGYMYGSSSASTYNATHSNTTNSTVKTIIDDWYSRYLSSYSSYVADAIYCNDRKVVTDDSFYHDWWGDYSMVAGNGIGTSDTIYEIYSRIHFLENTNSIVDANPSLKCSQSNDRFTKGSSINGVAGNGKLIYPIGLLTLDEVFLAGGYRTINQSFYLYSGTWMWTMTPTRHVYLSGAMGPYVTIGGISSWGVSYFKYQASERHSIFPVISLKADALSSGSGTASDPFRVK